MARKLNPFSAHQFLDANGDPYNQAQLFTYLANGSTKVTTTQDLAGGSNHANPIILNSKGFPADGAGNAQEIWQDEGEVLKLVLAPVGDTDPPASPIESWPDLPGINDASTITDEWQSGATPTFVSTTSLTLVGDVTSTYQVGRRIRTTNTGGTIYSTILTSVYTTLTTLTVVNDSGVLDSGLSAISYGLLTATNSSIPGGTHQAATTFSKVITFSASTYQAEGANIAAATDTDIWAVADGNTVHLTGTDPVTDWGTAPQAGASMRVICDALTPLTYNATTNDIEGGVSITCAVGDILTVYARSVSSYKVSVNRYSGVAVATTSSGLSGVKYFGYPTTYSDTFTTDFGADANEIVVSPAPTQPFVIDATPWRLTTNGTLPAGLSLATDYYIVTINATTDIELSTTPFGTPVTLTDDGSGTHTIAPLGIYTKPTSNFSRVKVTISGSGGAGGGGGDADEMGSGGAAGGAAIGIVEDADIGATETITIGAGATGVGAGAGANGNTSSFGSIASATGGTGGTGDTAVSESTGVAGGTGVGLDIIITGNRGQPAPSAAMTGHGGEGILGGAGMGTPVLAGTAVGSNGSLGSGGGGSGTLDTTNAAGAHGGGGFIIIEEYV